jgi:hypothetical protein
MSGGGLIVSIVMLVAGIAWLVLPYVRSEKARGGAEDQKQRDQLKLSAAYERALLTVRDLDEDYQVGKLSQEAYASERARWVEEGAALLEALEKAGGTAKKSKRAKTQPSPEQTPAAANDDPVEQAIAAYVRAREKTKHS